MRRAIKATSDEESVLRVGDFFEANVRKVVSGEGSSHAGISSGVDCQVKDTNIQTAHTGDSIELCYTRGIHKQLELTSQHARTRRSAIKELHLAGYLQLAGLYDGHFLRNYRVRISPNDLHNTSFLLSDLWHCL